MYLGSSHDYEFHSLELKKTNPDDISAIVEACKHVESRVWKASEKFEDYLNKQSALFYVKHQDHVVAFALFDVSVKDKSLIVAANECMILPEHHGKGLASLFAAIMISHIRFDRRLKKEKRHYDKVIFLSLTVNFKLMSAFKHYSFLTLSNSFSPCNEISEIAHHYLKKEGITPLEDGIPYFAKAAFPKSLKEAPKVNIPSFVPHNFDLHRGDGFLYICKINNFFILAVVAWFIQYKSKFKFTSEIKKRFAFGRRNNATSVIYSDHKDF
jgi:hypothetical protein